ncbi:E3 ubiquitin/ISG15 ligase TRIM25-like [Ruditapes philippinarum]|uniref:E3 ubiquitin/ISG15 ligase TRIM25-like n=1 Tax=Ruditapes philippinarum TaxID=129788 RepID=UPI00295A694B|nr:E3 ubiquitin/ISG15 ligase TRIM25-like [Ruditapes philippinarum]
MAHSDCKTSDMEDTKHCTPCKTKDKNTKAEYYCTDCEAYYCEECFELHPPVPYLAKDIVLKHEDIAVWSRDQYKCSTHGKNIEFFCRDHKMLCCHVCISLKHRSCTNMDYIQEEAMKQCLDDDKANMMKQTEEQLRIIELNYDKVKQKAETNQASRTEYIVELESFRSRIKEMFDSHMDKAVEVTNEKFDQNTKNSENIYEKLVCFKNRLKNLKQQLKSSTIGKEALVSISLQRGEELIEEISNELSSIDFSIEQEKYKPVIDGTIEEYLEGLDQIAIPQDEKMMKECIASEIYTEEITFDNNSFHENNVTLFIRSLSAFPGVKSDTRS